MTRTRIFVYRPLYLSALAACYRPVTTVFATTLPSSESRRGADMEGCLHSPSGPACEQAKETAPTTAGAPDYGLLGNAINRLSSPGPSDKSPASINKATAERWRATTASRLERIRKKTLAELMSKHDLEWLDRWHAKFGAFVDAVESFLEWVSGGAIAFRASARVSELRKMMAAEVVGTEGGKRRGGGLLGGIEEL